MKWCVANIIISYRLKEGVQQSIPIYENSILFYGNSDEEILNKAIKYGQWLASVEDNLEINDAPAYTKYEGIRKITEIFDEEFDLKIPMDGIEVSYSYMELDNEKDVVDLVEGRRVKLSYIDDDL